MKVEKDKMVYVDSLRKADWRYQESCHLTADTKEELVAFGIQLGLKEKWLQISRSGKPHFDLTKSKRATAIELGKKLKCLVER